MRIGGAFACLLDLDPKDVAVTLYDGFKEATDSTTDNDPLLKKRWSWAFMMALRDHLPTKKSCQDLNGIPSPQQRENNPLNKLVKAALKTKKQKTLEYEIKRLELDHKHNNKHNLFI